MYYVVQKNMFRERNYNLIYKVLDRLKRDWEIVDVLPFIDTFEVETDRKDVYVFGGTKLARIAKQYDWNPGSLLNENHNYEVYSQHYKEHLLNYDSHIITIGEEFNGTNELYFFRPVLDDKMFTGKVMTPAQWNDLRKKISKNYKGTRDDSKIQVARPKNIYKEFRLFIVGGEVVTGSQYCMNRSYYTSPVIDEEVLEFAKEMISLFTLASSFVMDIALTEEGCKIVECGCINCAGFYDSDLMKLVIAIEDYYG